MLLQTLHKIIMLAKFLVFIASIFGVLSPPPAVKEYLQKIKTLNRFQKIIIIIVVLLLAAALFVGHIILSGSFIPKITQVMQSNYNLNLNVGDSVTLSAVVLYENNKKEDKVLWVSSNASVVQIDENGLLTAISEGNAMVTAQASNRKSVERAECVVNVLGPLKGYTISVQRTTVENYIYIYVRPKDKNVSRSTLYAKSPSGKVFTPAIDDNDLYHFYTEAGTWTVYAELESEYGTYEANKDEDFVTVEINDVSPTAMDAFLAGLPISP